LNSQNQGLTALKPSQRVKEMPKANTYHSKGFLSNLHRFAEKWIISDTNIDDRTEQVAKCFRSKHRRTQVFKEPGIATIRELIALSDLFNLHPVVLHDEYGMARGNISDGLLRILREHEEHYTYQPNHANPSDHFTPAPAAAEAPG
jgi:hypothetical protein